MDTVEVNASLFSELGSSYDAEQRARLSRGIDQVARLWQPEDGDASALRDFVLANFAADPEARDA